MKEQFEKETGKNTHIAPFQINDEYVEWLEQKLESAEKKIETAVKSRSRIIRNLKKENKELKEL